MHAIVRIALVALSVSAAAGCTTVQVRSVGTNTGQLAYDLTGPNLDVLAAQAERMCPKGHAVLRQAYRGAPGDDAGDSAMGVTVSPYVFTYDVPPEQAQMTIVCRG